MTKKAVIVFVKNPEPGNVNTRLAEEIGETGAVDIYRELLQHTHDVLIPVSAGKFIFYADEINRLDLWETNSFYKQLQHGNDLGERMQHAFSFLFELGYERVMIIGNECPQLTTHHLNNAFELLETHDVCIGPLDNGEYYFLGLRATYPPLFSNKAWGTNTVYNSTMNDALEAGLTVGTIENLRVVSTQNDWLELREMLSHKNASSLVK